MDSNDTIFSILNQLENLIKNSKSVLFSSGCVQLDVRQAKVLINEIKASLPDDLARAREILRQEQAILQKAEDYKAETEKFCETKIIKAQNDASALVEQSQIVKAAKEKASVIMKKADDYNRALKDTAIREMDRQLADCENYLTDVINHVRSSREEINGGAIKNIK